MTKEEYLKEVALTKKKHNVELYEIAKKYAMSKSNVCPGDIISDGAKTIKADDFDVELPHP